MAKQGANEAYNDILQKVDEVLILAQSHLGSLKNENSRPHTPTSDSSTSSSTISSPFKRNRSRSSNSSSSKSNYRIKTHAYCSLDKKKAMIVTKMKGNEEIDEKEIRKIEKIISRALEQEQPSIQF
ncbi:unnamed protein product [Caenorhabditis angaria]|uniref:Uncharacterized protein n=1 Tax=Caenorhabditis angaria TaxID=860376 RepID=A0A9P1N152_9PELO|nr:unnamed protein product [Caenorhabditis angaria]